MTEETTTFSRFPLNDMYVIYKKGNTIILIVKMIFDFVILL